MIYGYARVSTPGQDTADQVAELKAAGCDKILTETASAAPGRKRQQLARALAMLAPGDVILVTRLNRLARSARDALNHLEAITAKGADFRSLREGWADTTTSHGRFMVTVFAGLAELDREMILERTAEGRTGARRRGVRFGRKPTLSLQAVRLVRESDLSVGELAATLNVSESTIKRARRDGYVPAPPARPQQIDISDFPPTEKGEGR
jgi:DNA invertase Pin-like site-specific DNA recombinase